MAQLVRCLLSEFELRIHIKKPSVTACACNGGERRISWDSAASLAYLVTSMPVRDPISKSRMDGSSRTHLRLSSSLHVHVDT